MRTPRWLCPLLLAAMTALASAPPAEPPGLLDRIRSRVATHLSELPNYTCHELIERSLRPADSHRYHPLDKIRVEVAYVGGKELFSWPGEGRFQEKPLEDLVGGGGAIGDGFFAGHARALFVKGRPEFRYAGESQWNGRACVRYDYRVPRERSAFALSDARSHAVVGYHGAFWADARTLDLVRLEVEVDEIPSKLGIRHAKDVVEYQRVRIGDRDFLLLSSAEMSLTDPKGIENRNVIRLSSCRQYIGESVLKFDDAENAAAPKPVETLALPPGLEIEAVLEATIQGTPMVGDPVSATVSRDARKDGRAWLAKGAVLSGRILRVERRENRGFHYFILGIAFSSFEGNGRRGEFLANLEHIGGPGEQYHLPLAPGPPPQASVWSSAQSPFAAPQAGEAIVYVRGESLRIPAGTPLTLRIARAEDFGRR